MAKSNENSWPDRHQIDGTLKPKEVLWRYLDTAKFLDLVHNKSLFFPRGDQFIDRYEGAFTKLLREAIDEAYQFSDSDLTGEDFRNLMRKHVFVNCWHASINDSMAMWRIYGRIETALAITSTVDRLKDVMVSSGTPHNWMIRKVQYVNHWHNPTIDIVPFSNIFSYKLKAYDFEKEVRIIISKENVDFKKPTEDTGISVPVSLNKLLRSIVVAPDAPLWFVELIQGIAKSHGIEAPVRRSKLAFDPP